MDSQQTEDAPVPDEESGQPVDFGPVREPSSTASTDKRNDVYSSHLSSVQFQLPSDLVQSLNRNRLRFSGTESNSAGTTADSTDDLF